MAVGYWEWVIVQTPSSSITRVSEVEAAAPEKKKRARVPNPKGARWLKSAELILIGEGSAGENVASSSGLNSIRVKGPAVAQE